MKLTAPQFKLKHAVWLLVIAPLLVLLAGAYFAVAQPNCAGCHNQDTVFASATQKTAHANVKCVACHVSPAPLERFSFGFRQMFHMVVPVIGGDGKEWAAVDNARCVTCHKQINVDIVSAKGIRIDHDACAHDTKCTDCHSAVAHGTATAWVRTYDMETCLACHVTQASTKCNVCHDERNRETRVSTGVFAITHGKDWRKTHGMGNTATCTVCHTAAKCEKCHGPGLPHDSEFLGRHSQVAASPAAKCFSCHDKSFCSSCHGIEMPHSKAFTRGHAKSAKRDPKLCQRCHADPDCTKCHETHVHPGGAVGNLRKPTSPSSGGK